MHINAQVEMPNETYCSREHIKKKGLGYIYGGPTKLSWQFGASVFLNSWSFLS